jgi:MscS family membrane protein
MIELLNSLDINSVLIYSTALAIILGVKLFSPIISKIIIYIFHKLFNIKTKVTESGFYGPLKFIFTVLGFGIAINFLQLPEGVINLYNKIFKILFMMATAKALSNCLKPDSTFFTKLETSTKFNGNEALNNFIGKILKAVIYIVTGYMILTDLNYDLGGLAAGLGIGSAVVALAAQDFVKSLIGGFTIITDKPFEIGDYIEVGTFQGTVIDITFRSTRIKAVNNAIISMPNSVIVTEYVKNWSKLENRRIEMNLRISLNSSTETITRCISKLRTMLKSNENIIEDTVSVYLDKIEEDANIIWIALHINTQDYKEYLKLKEEINCNILEVLEKENIELVYPTQKVYMKTI